MALEHVPYGTSLEAVMIGALELMGIKAKPENVEERIRKGLPYRTVETVVENTGMTASMIASSLEISKRTLMNHRREGTLSPVVSDKIYRFSRIFAMAMEMTGSKEEASEWLNEEAPELGGVTPASLLDTDYGAERVEALIDNTMAGVP
jgi:putative toxin-antitoxin system antitoxin component (TIGR02293 family)